MTTVSQSSILASQPNQHRRAERGSGLSLRWKATLAAIALGTIPIVLLGAMADALVRRNLQEQVINLQKDRALGMADKVNRFLFDRYGDIQVLANLPFLNDPQLAASMPEAEKKRILDDYMKTYRIYDSIAVSDATGRTTLSVGAVAPRNFAELDYFQAVVRTRQPVVNPPRRSVVTGQWSMFFAAPIKEVGTGELLGMIRTRIPLEGITTLLDRFGAGTQDYEWHIVGPDGRFFAAQEQAHVGRSAAEDFRTFPLLRGQNAAVAGEDIDQLDGVRQLVAVAPFPSLEGLPRQEWQILLAQDLTVAEAVSNQLRLLLLGGIGVATLLVAAIAVSLADRATRPVLQATAAVQKLGEGELQTRLEVKGNDELARLGSNINLMAERIQGLLGEVQTNASQLKSQSKQIEDESELLQYDVGHLLEVVSAVEEGDLTIQAQVSPRATGLVADTFNRLVEQLVQVLTQVLQSAQEVKQGSLRLEEQAQIVSANATQQAESVTQVLELTEQVEHSALISTTQVEMANQSLLTMRATVEQGQESIVQMTQGIEVLQQGSDRILQQMKALGEFVGLADQFVQEQGQIASMTQVLALNATLVASRAAEQRDPRQFTVVAREFEAIADQVGSLAQQTNLALETLQQRTNQIHKVVSAIDTDVQGLGELVQEFTQGVEQSNLAFTEVRSATAIVAESGEAVSHSSQEIALAAQSTATAMRSISELAQRTMQFTLVSQSETERLEALAQQLLQSIRFFQLPTTSEYLPSEPQPALPAPALSGSSSSKS